MSLEFEKLIQLLYTPMTSNKMVEAIDALGLEQPVLDEEYEIRRRVSVHHEETDISLVFEELKDHKNSSGDLCLFEVSCSPRKRYKVGLPFGLEWGDTYENCCKKFGAPADYLDKNLKETRIWKKKLDNGLDYIAIVNFYDEDTLEELLNVVVQVFNEKDEYKLPNPEKSVGN